MNITVTLTASSELLEVLQTIAGNLGGAPKAAAEPVTQEKATRKNGTKVMAVVAPVETTEAPAETKPETPEPEAKKAVEKANVVTLEIVRAAAQAKAQSGKREQLKGLLDRYEVKNVGGLPEEKYDSFYKEIASL